MSEMSLVGDVADALHNDPTIRRRVGGRVHLHQSFSELPDIIVSAIGEPKVSTIVLTCRAKSPGEADKVGSAVMSALVKTPSSLLDGRNWVAVQDRSGYDAGAKAYRRVISVEPRPNRLLKKSFVWL